MAKDILPKELSFLKLTKEDSDNLVRFCYISAPIIDGISSIREQIKKVESYIEEWQKLEKPISDIIRNIKKGD